MLKCELLLTTLSILQTKIYDTDVINGCFYGWKNLKQWKGRDFFHLSQGKLVKHLPKFC